VTRSYLCTPRAPGSPWENGYIESFNSRLRDELLNDELFVGLAEARSLIEDWRVQYNTVRPHSSLNYITPMESAVLCALRLCTVSRRTALGAASRQRLRALLKWPDSNRN